MIAWGVVRWIGAVSNTPMKIMAMCYWPSDQVFHKCEAKIKEAGVQIINLGGEWIYYCKSDN